MGSITIKILLQSVNVGQIAKKTIQVHIPKDLLKIINDTPTNTQHHTQSEFCAKHGKLVFENRGNPCCKNTGVSSVGIKKFQTQNS